MPTSLTSFANSEFRMRFREQYVTEGLNMKLAVNTPPGTYRGFVLGPHGSNDTITVEADPDSLDHVAVYQTADGFSLTVRKTGGDYAVDLSSLVDASQKSWVIAIYADYTVGSTTTAGLRAYEYLPTDEFTPAAEKDELVVLGMVTIPAGGGVPITSAYISRYFRTPSWQALAEDAVVAGPLIRNGNFSLGYPGTVLTGYDLPFWQILNPPDDVNDGSLKLDESDPYSEPCALVLAYIANSITTKVEQPVLFAAEDKVVYYRIRYKPLKVATAGTAYLTLRWRDKTGGSLATSNLPLDLSATSVDYITVETSSKRGSTTPYLYMVEIALNGLTFGSAGNALLIDDVQVWVSGGSSREAFLHETRQESQKVLQTLVLTEASDPTAGGAALHYDSTTPSGEGSILLERRDRSSSSGDMLPALDYQGRLVNVGSRVLDTAAHQRLPRISGATNPIATGNYTLIEEWGPSGGAKYRKYLGGWPYGECWTTWNAFWNGSAWESDYSGQATAVVDGSSNGYVYTRDCSAGAETWTSWPRTMSRRYVGDTAYNEAYKLEDFSYAPLLLPGPGGHIGYRGLWFHDELPYKTGALASGTHDVWDSFASGSGTVTSEYNSKTQVRLTSTAGAGFLYMHCGITPNESPSFSAVARSVTSSGNWFIGFGNTNKNLGFHFDPTGYGDTNIRIRIYDSTSTPRYVDTGVTLFTAWFYRFVMQTKSLDSGANSRIYWYIYQDGTLGASGKNVWSPGYGILNPTTVLYFGYYTEIGAELICESCSLYTTPG